MKQLPGPALSDTPPNRSQALPIGEDSASDSGDESSSGDEPVVPARAKNPKGKAAGSTKKKAPRIASKKKTARGEQQASKRSDVKVLESFEDERYSDVDEETDMRSGGGKVDPALLKVSKPCFDRSRDSRDPEAKRVRCLGSRGCNTTWNWPRARARVLGHVMGCDWLPAELKDVARTALVTKDEKKLTKLIPSRRKRAAVGRSSDDSDSADGSEHNAPRDPKRGRHDTKSQTTKDPDAKAAELLGSFLEEGIKTLKEKGDNKLVLLLVGCGIPPRVIDTGFFKNFISSIQPKYQPPSSTTMCDRLIPTEAARCHLELLAELQEMRNLTISFDGGKLRRPRSVYTVSVTTPKDRKSYLLHLSDSSRVSHTANYISNEVVGPVRPLVSLCCALYVWF